jgi:hypothetical protein
MVTIQKVRQELAGLKDYGPGLVGVFGTHTSKNIS